jgi:hypothetical protein
MLQQLMRLGNMDDVLSLYHRAVNDIPSLIYEITIPIVVKQYLLCNISAFFPAVIEYLLVSLVALISARCVRANSRTGEPLTIWLVLYSWFRQRLPSAGGVLVFQSGLYLFFSYFGARALSYYRSSEPAAHDSSKVIALQLVSCAEKFAMSQVMARMESLHACLLVASSSTFGHLALLGWLIATVWATPFVWGPSLVRENPQKCLQLCTICYDRPVQGAYETGRRLLRGLYRPAVQIAAGEGDIFRYAPLEYESRRSGRWN